MTLIEQAQKILDTEPLPDDAEAQIDALYEQASDEEKTLFGWIYEGLDTLINSKIEPDHAS